MTFKEFAEECRKEFPTATEVSVVIRPYNMQVSIIYDEPERPNGSVQLLNGSTVVNWNASSDPTPAEPR